MTPKELSNAVQVAIENIVSGDGQMLNKFVLITEIIESDGDRTFWFTSSSGIKAWDRLGLLDYAMAVEHDRAGFSNEEGE